MSKTSKLTLVATVVAGLSATTELPKPYEDGCSGGISWVYRNVLRMVPPQEVCCDKHDVPYGKGGTPDEKVKADVEFFWCVADKTNYAVASLYFVGVTIGGQPFFPFGWRWGYDLPYGVSWYYGRGGAE